MTEELDIIFQACEEQMEKSIQHLEAEMTKVRAGKANPTMVSHLMVDYYGAMTPLPQVANISTPDARTLTIQPWERKMIQPIEKAILMANIGLTPQNNGETIILNIPQLTEERRRDLAKQVHHLAEHARIGLRAARKDANDEIKALQKDGLSEDLARDAEEQVQQLIKTYSDKVDAHVHAKEKEIMTV
jgi:ribosome recycling factor